MDATKGWYEAGHVALVTGGSRGLGKALAQELLRLGLRVIIDGRDGAALESARAELAAAGDVVAIPGDVAADDHVHELVAAAERLGRLDLLVNNASALGDVPLRAWAATGGDTLRTVLDVNFVGPLHLIRHALPLLRAARPGTIMNITSDAAVSPYPSWGPYGASKAALEHASRILAVELEGSQVRVLVADPGDMDTAMHRDALPDADPSTLRRPADSALALTRAVASMPGSYARFEAATEVWS